MYIMNNEYIKWNYNGETYILRVETDDLCPEDPRTWDNIATFACWHRDYKLGDDIGKVDADDFFRQLVRENVPYDNIKKEAEAGKLTGIRIEKNNGLYDIYETYYYNTAIVDTEPREALEYGEIDGETVVDYIIEDLTIKHCLTLLEPYMYIVPLWLYDHTQVHIKCGYKYPFTDKWDGGQVGFAIVRKDDIIKEYGDIDDWKARAQKIIEAETKTYDYYISGEVYGYSVFDVKDTDEPIDLCWGFYGADIIENGIIDYVGLGLAEAIKNGDYTIGEIKIYTETKYVYA